MANEGLRTTLLLSLVAAIAWVAAGACFGIDQPYDLPFPETSLCIHR